MIYRTIMPAPLKYSNDAERQEARRLHRKRYYERNKHKVLLANMRWRHKTNPPQYIQETSRLKEELARLTHVYEQKKLLLEAHLARLEEWNPLTKSVEKTIENI